MIVRKPIVAGRFYPADPEELKNDLKKYFENIENEENRISENPHAVISPHAGYMFSAPIAARAFSGIDAGDLNNPLFVLLGPDHTGRCPGISLSAADLWETPLGNCTVNDVLRDSIVSEFGQITGNAAHDMEHSIEVQLPFLQYIMKERLFSILPIALSVHDMPGIDLAAGILRYIDEKHNGDIVYIISSDFSHYVSPEKAREDDLTTIDIILKRDVGAIIERASKGLSVCGIIPIIAYMRAFSEKIKGELLYYGTSGDTMPMDEVVGYAAVLFRREGE